MPTEAKGLIAAPDRTFSFDAFELADPGPHEVLVEIEASGVCHTDVDLLNLGFRHVMGHEGAGRVVGCGEGVHHVDVGDRVVLNWALPCGACYQCARGMQNICASRARIAPDKRVFRGKPIVPSFGIATLATHTLVPAAAVVRVETGITPPEAALLGCGVMTGFGSVINVAKVPREASVVVIGIGGVGLSVVQGAAYAEADPIVAIDVNPGRLEMARRHGATHTIVASTRDEGLNGAARQVESLVGRGADYAFECTAVAALAASPLAMICNGGTAVAVSGFEEVVPIDMRLFEFDKTYVNPLYGGCNPSRDFPRLLELHASGRLRLREMAANTYPLSREGLAQALENMRAGTVIKSVLLP